jgi:hypothetical protein
MPVGKIFNPSENQILFNPYGGKAIRLALENKELANRALEQEIGMADEKFALERQRADTYTKQVQLQEAALNQRIDEFIAKGKGDDLEREADIISGIGAGSAAIENPDERNAFRVEKFKEFADTVEDEENKAGILKIIEDGVVTDAEMDYIVGYADSVKGRVRSAREGGDFTLSEGAQRYDEQGRLIAENPKDVVEKPEPYKAPAKNEVDDAEKIVESDDRLKKLGKDERRVAARILADEIRQLLQAGYSYPEAATMAKELLKKRLKDEPNWWSKKVTLDLGESSLEQNEYIIDGVKYVEDENAPGKWRRAD